MTNIERFLSHVYPEPNTGCWLWAACTNKKTGYGVVGDKANDFGHAHRKSYFLFKGDFDRSMHVLHTCDVRCCVNPDHLYLGSNLDNSADKMRRGRQANGERIATSKLNVNQVLQIRIDKKLGISSREIGGKYGIARQNVNAIISRKHWSHI